MAAEDQANNTSNEVREIPNDGVRGHLRTASLICAVVGAIGSVGSVLRVGEGAPGVLLVLFVGWVLTPFFALVLANLVGKRWTVLTRTTIYCITLAVALASLAIYGYVVFWPRPKTPTALFLLFPLGSLVASAVAVAIAGLISRRRNKA